MKICRYMKDGKKRWGIAHNGEFADLSEASGFSKIIDSPNPGVLDILKSSVEKRAALTSNLALNWSSLNRQPLDTDFLFPPLPSQPLYISLHGN